MYKNIIFLLTILLLSGCINKRGISTTYYNDCREYYDARGYYHKVCDENLIEFKNIPEHVENAKKVITHTEYEEETPKKHKVVW